MKCPRSKPYAVIKDADGSVAGCHETEEAAKRQLAALYASEEGKAMRQQDFKLERLETKADDGEANGAFTALVSVFGNVDHVGDRMMPGAFSKTLKRWRESGDPIPIILSHQWEDPMAFVGKADPRAVMETDEGLVVQGQLNTATEVGKQVYGLMKDRVLKSFSFGYTVPPGGEELDDKGANNVSEVDLVEVGPCLKGANPDARLLGIKSAIHEGESPAYEVVDEDGTTTGTLAITNAPEGVTVTTTGTGTTNPVPLERGEKDLPAEEVDTADGDTPEEPPAKPSAKDSVRNEIDRAMLDVKLGL